MILYHTSSTESDETFTGVLKVGKFLDLHQKSGIGSIANSFICKRRVVCTRLQSWILEHIRSNMFRHLKMKESTFFCV